MAHVRKKRVVPWSLFFMISIIVADQQLHFADFICNKRHFHSCPWVDISECAVFHLFVNERWSVFLIMTCSVTWLKWTTKGFNL